MQDPDNQSFNNKTIPQSLTIKIGTRGSKLALWQAEFVSDLLKKGGLATEIITIDTKGDKILDTSIAKIGSKGVFTEELEEQLRSGTIDIAVHSAKDLQSQLPEDLEILAFTEREKVNDVLVSFQKNLPQLSDKQPFTIGTSSTRRVATLRHFFPHIHTVDMRGNLQTRLKKLENGACDALILAFAGVHRMGFDEYIAETLSTEIFTPAVGQGSVAIEGSRNLAVSKRLKIRALLNHSETEKCLLAERSFLKTLQGGCSIPAFGLANTENQYITITGGIISLDGKEIIKFTLTHAAESPEIPGMLLAEKVLASGGDKILEKIRELH